MILLCALAYMSKRMVETLQFNYGSRYIGQPVDQACAIKGSTKPKPKEGRWEKRLGRGAESDLAESDRAIARYVC